MCHPQIFLSRAEYKGLNELFLHIEMTTVSDIISIWKEKRPARGWRDCSEVEEYNPLATLVRAVRTFAGDRRGLPK